jgi:hypothetical protein
MKPMSGNLPGLRKRLARVEKVLAQTAKQKELASCICQDLTFALPHEAEQFEAEVNRTCPVHGFRRLGQILPVTFVKPDKTYTEESIKLLQLVEAYELRLSQLSQSGLELEYDSQEP